MQASHLLTGDKYAFLKMKAPASYVAGLGRGAAGFTTRSDIGPARAAEEEAAGAEPTERGEKLDSEQFQDPENETGLFAGTVYEADDEEADRVYEAVDFQMDGRRRAKREAREAEEEARLRAERPTIQSQFADLKRGLADMTDDQWETLPEVNNLVGNRAKKMRMEGRGYMVPDSILVGNRDRNALETSLDAEQMARGLETPQGAMTDFAEIGQARDRMLQIKLEQASGASGDSAGGSTTIDPKAYMTGLESQVIKTEAEIGDYKKARALMQSMIKTNPKHAPGWIAAAWVEHSASKIVQARKIIAQGCEHCPKSEDVWIAATQLNTNENAKIILANAVQELPQSVRIWLRAVELEGDVKAKKRVLRKALEHIPASVKLWKETVKLEDNPEDARILLERAVEVIPHSQELWLALARLSSPDRARQVLNAARKKIPTSHEIWIAAGRLQEQEGNNDQVDKIIAAGVAALKKNGAELSREEWLAEAEKCENQGSRLTCQAIIKATLHLDVEEEDRQDVWLDDAKSATAKGLVHSARAIYAYALNVFPQKQAIWRLAAELEMSQADKESLMALLNRAVELVPQAEVLWLMMAKELWKGGDVPAARQVLGRAFEANPESESIWLAAIKLEAENGQIEAARQLMERARDVAGTERIWIKAAAFERSNGTSESTLAAIRIGLTKYPTAPKLHMMLAQQLLANAASQAAPADPSGRSWISLAREALVTGCKKCPHAIPLWLMSAQLEEDAGLRIKARALLESGRKANPKSEELWLESVRLEERDGSGAAKGLLARALQELPTSGSLHAHQIWGEPRPTRRARSVEALKKTNNSPTIIVTVARGFWAERKVDKARSWFERVVAADPDFGDGWAWWWKFERQHGTKEDREALLVKCTEADPHHGPVWQAIAKDPKNEGAKLETLLGLVADVVEQKSSGPAQTA